MFTYALHGLRFCSEDADASLADRIGGAKYSDDETFIAVLRALLAPRFGEDTSKSVKVVQNTVVCGSSEDDAASFPANSPAISPSGRSTSFSPRISCISRAL